MKLASARNRNDSPAAESGEVDTANPEQRRVMLLQGLMGPFFRELGKRLIARGHTVFKINFNGGDRLYWRLPNGIDYGGPLADWPQTFTRLLDKHRITDVMLFGDCRAHHAAAIEICRTRNLQVWVLEEGYIRPDWVTMELGGVNGHSSLPRHPQWYRDAAATLPPLPKHKRVHSSFRRRATQGLLYNAADVLTRWHYKGWVNHRPWHPLIEGVGWARKLRNQRMRKEQAAQIIGGLGAGKVQYFLFPLQLESDAQIRLHSPFDGVVDALELVINSFAAHAPATARLVVKEHPLDNGLRDWERDVRDLALRAGVASRIDYLAWGDIEAITERALGMVTINSTSGTLGLARGVPVIVLGNAIYDIPGLTFQNGLDRFWTEALPPDPETFAAFHRVLVDRCLIPGGFFSNEAMSKVVEHAVARFEGKMTLAD